MTVVPFPSLQVCRLEAQDLAAASELMHKVWHDTYRAKLPAGLRAQRSRAFFADYLERRIETCWTAWVGRRVAALATVASNCIDDLWVAKRYRRRGIGSRLVAEATAHLQASGFRHAQAGCEGFNAEAMAFFEALGWQRIGSEPLSLVPGRTIEAVVFSRQLTTPASPGPVVAPDRA